MDTQIAKEFEEFGVDVNAEVLAKCLEICISYNIEDASEFVEQWIAYSVSHFNGGEPTIEYLDEFERKDLAGKRDKQLNAKKQLNSTSALNGNAGGGGSNFQDDEDDEMLGAYICNTPKQGQQHAVNKISRNPNKIIIISSKIVTYY
ncbi:POLA2.2 family protein [Megaselia abdita]